MLAEVLPSKELVVGKIVNEELLCSARGVEMELSIHIFKNGLVTRAISFGNKWGGSLGK